MAAIERTFGGPPWWFEPERVSPSPTPVGVVQGAGQQPVSAGQLAEFIDCDWPLGYLAG